jgi:hypothetical protein
VLWHHFSCTHVLQHHFSSHYFTSWIRRLFPIFLEDYEPNQDLELSFDSFNLTFQCMSNLSTSGSFGMVFEHLWDFFHPKDFVSGFPHLFQLCFHIAQGHISHWITHIFAVACLLAMTKPLGGIYPIAVGETLYQFTSHCQGHEKTMRTKVKGKV